MRDTRTHEKSLDWLIMGDPSPPAASEPPPPPRLASPPPALPTPAPRTAASRAAAPRTPAPRTPPPPTPTGEETRIASALSDVFRILGDLPGSARVRELRAQARFYDRAIQYWASVAPSRTQLDAMLDVVTELHGKTLATRGV